MLKWGTILGGTFAESGGVSLMKYRGTVKDGVVVLEGHTSLAEGTVVEVEPVRETKQQTLGQRLKKFAGTAKNLPSDMARNHDHYLHGQPKK
jgi:hypothetical protein